MKFKIKNRNSEKVKRWCRENISPPGMSWWTANPEDYYFNKPMFELEIVKIEDAVLFKLANSEFIINDHN